MAWCLLKHRDFTLPYIFDCLNTSPPVQTTLKPKGLILRSPRVAPYTYHYSGHYSITLREGYGCFWGIQTRPNGKPGQTTLLISGFHGGSWLQLSPFMGLCVADFTEEHVLPSSWLK
jgi:hypothetical protein